MLKFTEQIIDLGMSDKVFTAVDLKILLKGTDASRFGLLNKAIAKGEIIQLKRGVYTLNQKYNPQKLGLFYVANQIIPCSYISLESALSHNGWIPEGVNVVASVINEGRTKTFVNALGEFHYLKIPIQPYEFYTGIKRLIIDGKPVLIASGLRGLMDLVYEKGHVWQGLDFLFESLRIEPESLNATRYEEYIELNKVYKSKRVLTFLNKLSKAIGKL